MGISIKLHSQKWLLKSDEIFFIFDETFSNGGNLFRHFFEDTNFVKLKEIFRYFNLKKYIMVISIPSEIAR